MTVKEEVQKSESQLVILIDLDGVMVDFIGGWQKIWNAEHPDRPITQEASAFPLEVAYSGLASEEEIVEIMHRKDFFTNLEPIPGAIEAFKQMNANGLNLFICSSPTSNSSSYSEKADWVEMHLGREWVKRLILTKDKTIVHGDYLIDDNPVIKGVYKPSWEHILFDASYNRDEDSGDQFRITWRTWPSLLLYHAGYAL